MLRCDLCSAHDSVLLATKRGVSLRFATDEKQLRGSGRLSRGVRSIALRDGDEVAHTRPNPRIADTALLILLRPRFPFSRRKQTASKRL